MQTSGYSLNAHETGRGSKKIQVGDLEVRVVVWFIIGVCGVRGRAREGLLVEKDPNSCRKDNKEDDHNARLPVLVYEIGAGYWAHLSKGAGRNFMYGSHDGFEVTQAPTFVSINESGSDCVTALGIDIIKGGTNGVDVGDF